VAATATSDERISRSSSWRGHQLLFVVLSATDVVGTRAAAHNGLLQLSLVEVIATREPSELRAVDREHRADRPLRDLTGAVR
jgi:hypothetical protein